MLSKSLAIGLGIIAAVLAAVCGFVFLQNTQLQSDIHQLQANLEDLQSKYSDLQASYNKLQSEFNDLQSKYDKLLSDYNTLQSKYNEVKLSYSELQNKYISLQNEHKSLIDRYESLKANFTVLSHSYSTLLEEHRALQSNYTSLKQSYGELGVKYSELQNQYSGLQEQYTQLQSNYTALSEEYNKLKEKFKPLEEARKILKDLASNVSTSGLFNYIKGTYQEALKSEAQYLLWYSPQVPFDVDPGYFNYVIENPLYTGEVIVDWDVKGSNYYVMVMDTNNFLDFANGGEYYVIDYSFEDEKKPLYISTDAGQMLAFVIWNNGTSSIRVYNWSIYEKIGVYAPEDIRKVYAVNYYIATKVPYIYDIGEEAKPPLTTLSEGGDCEDRAVLVASMLLALGYSPDRVALALVDTNGDGEPDHVACLAQLPPDYDISYLAFDLTRLTILFTNEDPYVDYLYPPNAMLVPAIIVNGSNGQGYFIVIDPPDLTKGEIITPDLIPGNIHFNTYDILYAETIENLSIK